MNYRKLYLILSWTGFAILLAGCGGGDNVNTNTNSASGNNPPPTSTAAPVISFSANPATVTSGGSVTLQWSVTDATSCSASGDWAGTKLTSSSELINSISVNSSYSLTCTGAGGSASKTVMVSVDNGSDAVTGKVDSSYIDREGVNAIYVYSGTVTPDDYYTGNSNNPIMSVPVTQVENSCSWEYSIASLPAGDYTLAFTNQAANDDAANNDAISFQSVVNISKSVVAMTQDFQAKHIIQVGPGRTYQTPSAAAAVANNGDVIEIDAGLYQNDNVNWYQSNLTLRGVGGRAHLESTSSAISNGKGIWITGGNNIRVENIEFSGAKVADLNGAGIRADGSDLTVCNAYFHDNEEGILGGSGNVTIEYSEFDHNGNCADSSGCAHNMYIDPSTTKFVLQHSYTHRAYQGHNVKSRAQTNYILYNRIMDEQDGQSSYDIDIPNGGLTYIIGNLIQQGPNNDNSTIVSYGAEGLSGGRTHHLYVINNTMVNDYGSGTFLDVNGSATYLKIMNNIFAGGGTVRSGKSADVDSNNLVSNTPGLVDMANFDYELKAGSVAINKGAAPGIGDGFDLTPRYQYVHDSQRATRPADGMLDIGAYEYQ